MFFKDLSFEVQTAIRELTKDEVFQNRFGYDKVLGELDAQRFDKKKIVQELQAFRGVPLQVGDKKFSQLTVDAWANLWCLDSPFALGKDDIKQVDVDLFLAALEFTGDDLEALAISSLDYCKKHQLNEELARQICNKIISLAFSPLLLFPDSGAMKLTADQQPLYDAEWIANLVYAVHQVTGKSPEFIQKQMSLNAVCQYFVQFAKNQGMKGIGKKSEPEIIQLTDERCNTLIVERLIEKGIVKEEDKSYYEELLKAPSKRSPGFKIREEES